MIDLQQYRAVIGCFMCHSVSLCTCKYTGDLLYKAGKKNPAYGIFRNCMHIVLPFVVLIKILLLAGDIESNPGPTTRKCPQCWVLVHIRKFFCDNCGFSLKTKKFIKKCPSCSQQVASSHKNCACGYNFLKDMKKNSTAKTRMARNRANETLEASLQRKHQNKSNMAVVRANETLEASLQRKQSNKEHMSIARANEAPLVSKERKYKDASCKRSARNATATINDAISNFLTKIRLGPDFVCTVCHRMMYSTNVACFDRSKYCKGTPEILAQVFSSRYVSRDGKEWICLTCSRSLKKGNVPAMAKANGLGLETIPPELECLNELELRLISLRIPFMKMVSLPCGKQRGIHGPAVNVPSSVDTVVDVLPRLPSQCELIPLKLKRKLAYKGHYMYQYVRPTVVLNALKWLKINNPLYANVNINREWLADSACDDRDVFVGLFEQPSNENSTAQQHEPTVAVNSVPIVPMDVNSPYSDLANFVRQHGYTIHDVPPDGSCLFHAVAYHLCHCGIQTTHYNLRRDVASFLRNNPSMSDGTHYSSFISFNEPATDGASAGIESEEDMLLRVDPTLRWEHYLDRLSRGAWGDHVTIRGLSDMLNILIKIYCSHTCNIIAIGPSSGSPVVSINIGYMGQRHYLGLDPIVSSTTPVSTNNDTVIVTPPQSNNILPAVHSDPTIAIPANNSVNNQLNDSVIEEGDEHLRQITGGAPLTSMLSHENPEVEAQIYSVAPAEEHRPLDIMSDAHFEEMSNPSKFPYGKGGFNTNRPHKISLRKYFQQRLLDVDGRFAKDLEFLLASQYKVECKQIRDAANHYIWRQKPSGNFTASQARNRQFLSENVRSDKAYSFMKKVRGSPPYYQHTFYELLAMVRQLGIPTFFLTLTAADMKWPDIISIIARQYGVIYTDDEIEKLSFEEKNNWLKRNPVTAARHFHYRLHVFFHEFLKSSAEPLGKMEDYAIRIEFQARGSPHAHTLIWIKDSPKFGVASNEEFSKFLDKYISCAIPREEGELRDKVLLLQQHRHSNYCKRGMNCRFRFPHPPSTCTLVTRPVTGDNETEANEASKVLGKVRKLLLSGKTDVSLDELLRLAEVNPTDYNNAIVLSSRGHTIVLKRELRECNVNPYNASILLAWGANMDLQPVLNAYSCIMYIASYVMKAEKSMGQLLKSVTEEVMGEELRSQLKKVGTAFLSHRELSAQEAVYRILSLPLKMLSRSVVYVDSNTKEDRIAVLKDDPFLIMLDENDTNIFKKSLTDRYQHRPHSLQLMCLAEFAANYTTDYNFADDEDTDIVPSTDDNGLQASSEIILTDGYGRMKKRKREAVIRFYRFNLETVPTKWYRAKIMLYYPWFDEDTDLLGGYSSYEEHYNRVHSTISANEMKYSCNCVDNFDYNLDGPSEHIWDQIAPSTEESRARSLAEGSEVVTEVAQEDLQANTQILNASQSLGVRFEAAANREEIPPHEYRGLMRGLNSKQREMVMYNRDWCKRAVVSLRNNTRIEPYRVFLSGPGGVGKSHVIRLIQSDTMKLLRLSGEIEPTDVPVLLTAPTGVAAFNIGGMTLHSAFVLGSGQLGYQQLSSDKVNTLRARLGKLKLLIIDEVSMVGANFLFLIHKRLKQIKNVPDSLTFGDVSILAVGDLYQLPPVLQSPLFATISDGSLASLHGSGSLWKDEFKMIELNEIMRQRGDTVFAELLCHLRVNKCTDEDIALLKSRITTPESLNYPIDALHVYRLNADVDERNKIMLNRLASEDQHFIITACDSSSGRHIDLSNMSEKRSDTGNLHTTLKLAVGARVMLTVNVDVSDGLVNGARGEVIHFITDDDFKVKKILVRFDNATVGLKAMQASPFRTAYPNTVPLIKHETTFLLRGRRGNDITRLQFPLTLAWATTIHKVQGLTLERIVVDMKGGKFNAGQAYVAFSRVKSIEGLFILNFSASSIVKSDAVDEEMERLNNNLLPPLPQLQCVSLSSNHTTILLLNIRSISAKLDDLMCDGNIKYASILCFTETWLSRSHDSPHICNGHTILRCDRQSDNSKGGVLISVNTSVKVCNSILNNSGNIECIVTKLQLPNLSHVAIVLIYRPPSSTIDALLNVVGAAINCVSSFGLPTFIMGDFNIDLLSQNFDRRLINILSVNNFTQLVNSPTTDRGSLIDHIYFNGTVSSIFVEVSDTYYSDHDTIFCSFSC